VIKIRDYGIGKEELLLVIDLHSKLAQSTTATTSATAAATSASDFEAEKVYSIQSGQFFIGLLSIPL
jgi:hypothetical protein